MFASILFRSASRRSWRFATSHLQQFIYFASLLTAAALCSSPASAAGLQVLPVSMALSQDDRAGVFTLINNSDITMNAQARIFKWTQSVRDEYVLEPTSDLIVSPPIMQLAPGAMQELRLIRTQAAGQDEQHYRLIVDQLPGARRASPKPQKGISILIRHNIPVFLNSSESPTVQLQWRAQASGPDKTVITIHNPDKNRAQIAGVWLEKDGQTTVLSDGLTGYVLPGSTLVREFNRPLAQIQAAGTQIKAQINGTETAIQLGI